MRPLPLPPERVMLALLEGQAVDAALLDIRELSGEPLERAVARLCRWDLTLLAEKVEPRGVRALPPARLRRLGDFDAVAGFGLELVDVAAAYHAALEWVERAAPHLA